MQSYRRNLRISTSEIVPRAWRVWSLKKTTAFTSLRSTSHFSPRGSSTWVWTGSSSAKSDSRRSNPFVVPSASATPMSSSFPKSWSATTFTVCLAFCSTSLMSETPVQSASLQFRFRTWSEFWWRLSSRRLGTRSRWSWCRNTPAISRWTSSRRDKARSSASRRMCDLSRMPSSDRNCSRICSSSKRRAFWIETT